MKKMICTLLMITVALVLFAACAGSELSDGGSTTAPETTAETTTPEQTEETTGPVDDRITLVIGIGDIGDNPDLENCEFTKYLEEKTGFNLDFRIIDGKTTTYGGLFNAATKDISCLPDVFIDVSADEDIYNLYASKGIFVNLAAYFDDPEKSANFWAQVDAVRSDPNGYWDRLMDQMTQTMYTKDASGNKAVYGVPNVKTSLIDTIDFMPFINTKWLDAVKMDAPKTLNELRTVLRAFRDNDPNGNKERDEIPMMGYTTNTFQNDILAWLINFYIYYREDAGLNVRNGELHVPETDEAYREALKFIRDLLAEGLMAPQTLTYKVRDLKSILSNSDMIGVVVGDPKAMFANETVASRYSPLDMFGYAYYNQEKIQYNTFITANCKNVDAAWELLMCMYTEEAALFQNYGTQGEEWEYADGTVMTEYGLPAVIKVLKKQSQITDADNWKGSYITFTTYKISELIIDPNATGKDIAIQKLYAAQRKNYVAACEWTQKEIPETICPLLDYGDKAKDMAKTREKLQDVIKSWKKYFILGTKNIDMGSEWYQYLLQLENAGLKEYLSIAQQSYDQMYPNGHVKK